ncbi:integrase core domain protein [Holospora undulata HU1]|uniref:Integrase core domain protein n=2 Tax=Holospora TaxID=44747 RepID=A0A061JGI9_9PROT|nr:integrase core domain protein [Holospora undulata HU1]
MLFHFPPSLLNRLDNSSSTPPILLYHTFLFMNTGSKIRTDNGAQFTYALLAEHLCPKNNPHPFDATCKAHKLEHSLTQFRHPWTNGQVGGTNRIIKQYTTKIYIISNWKNLKSIR